jgi:hypothetical protein
MTLSQLFERRDGETLGFGAYDAIGGIEGAIAAHANTVFASATAGMRSELDPLLRMLVSDVSRGGDRTVHFIARAADRKSFETSAARKDLINMFVAGRLLVSDDSRIRVAHEALLRRWDRARQSVERIADAELRRTRLRTLVAAAAAFVFLATGVTAWYFYLSAEQQTRTAVANESRAFSALSRVAIADGRPNQAAQLALAAWPRDDRDQHLRLETTLRSLSKALAERLYLHQWRHNGPVNGALLSNDEIRILSWSSDGTLRWGNAATGQQIGPSMKHDGGVTGALLTKDETRILSWSIDGTLRLWDAVTSQQIGPAMKHDGGITVALLT